MTGETRAGSLHAVAGKLSELASPPVPPELAAEIEALARRVAEHAAESNTVEGPIDGGASGSTRILVVDDDPVSKKVLTELTRLYGEVTAVNDGETAIDTLRAASRDGAPYDLVLLDIELPAMSGHDVLKRIKALEALNVPGFPPTVIMASSLRSKEAVAASVRGGAAGYMLKPVDADRLADALGAAGFARPSRSA